MGREVKSILFMGRLFELPCSVWLSDRELKLIEEEQGVVGVLYTLLLVLEKVGINK